MTNAWPPKRFYTIAIEPVPFGYTLASTQWHREDLIVGLLDACEPSGWISRGEAEALAHRMIAATGQEVEELGGASGSGLGAPVYRFRCRAIS